MSNMWTLTLRGSTFLPWCTPIQNTFQGFMIFLLLWFFLLYHILKIKSHQQNHYGSMRFGHYKACCKHRSLGVWLEFNDSIVTQEHNPERIKSSSNYILFYIRRGIYWAVLKHFYKKNIFDNNIVGIKMIKMLVYWLHFGRVYLL